MMLNNTIPSELSISIYWNILANDSIEIERVRWSVLRIYNHFDYAAITERLWIDDLWRWGPPSFIQIEDYGRASYAIPRWSNFYKPAAPRDIYLIAYWQYIVNFSFRVVLRQYLINLLKLIHFDSENDVCLYSLNLNKTMNFAGEAAQDAIDAFQLFNKALDGLVMNSVMRYYVLDSDNYPIKAKNMLDYAWFMASERRIVLQNYIGHGLNIYISTVFLGIDSSYRREPLLFETMIQSQSNGQWLDGFQWRYTNYKEALKHHKALLHSITIGYRRDHKRHRPKAKR